MARTAIAPVVASDVGAVLPLAAANVDGGIIPPNSVLLVNNSSGGSLTVTIQTPAGAGVPSGLNLSDRTLVLANNSWGVIGPFDPTYYARTAAPDQGLVWVDFSTVAAVFVGVVQIPSRSWL